MRKILNFQKYGFGSRLVEVTCKTTFENHLGVITMAVWDGSRLERLQIQITHTWGINRKKIAVWKKHKHPFPFLILAGKSPTDFFRISKGSPFELDIDIGDSTILVYRKEAESPEIPTDLILMPRDYKTHL